MKSSVSAYWSALADMGYKQTVTPDQGSAEDHSSPPPGIKPSGADAAAADAIAKAAVNARWLGYYPSVPPGSAKGAEADETKKIPPLR